MSTLSVRHPAARAERRQESLLRDFAAGKVDRTEAMRLLDIDYAELIDRVAARGLSLPRLPADEAEAMADAFLRAWRAAPER